MSARSSSSKGYDPKPIEAEMYRRWMESGVFHHEPATPGDGNDYCIMIPLPNVTGALHLGHALNHTCQDIMTRRARMQGKATLWMPGTDHAGIATQSVVERRLFEQEGKTRHDLGREELVRRIWDWKDQFERRILSQMKLLGNSCDWDRTRFTLDEVCARAVRHTFFRMFRDGLIYRGQRLVNWDTQLQTAVSDDEVYHETVQSHLWRIRYPVTGRSATSPDAQPGRDYLVVATTRPETMLGDTAVAVHPDDPRYKDLIGKTCKLPLMDREIPIIADPILVKMEFGSGCVKVTPAHDPNDYDCGLRNGLEMVNILTPDGEINANGGRFEGMDRQVARREVVAALEVDGLMESVEDYQHEVGHSDRSKTAIEPYLSEQWFVRMGDVQGGVKLADGSTAPGLAQAAIDAVTSERVRFFPERYAKTYLDWLGEKRDWCIGRQLWWGHRIAVWYARGCDERAVQAAFEGRDDIAYRYDEENEQWLICVREGDLPADAIPGAEIEQDDDVLDTWFSSALWPHSTLGWPDKTPELDYWFPGSVLITSRDIITLWVARMVMTGLYNVGDIPFHHVYVHPKILDGDGQTMSKSKGNGVDPVEIIGRYGADATRFSIAYMTTETQDVRMPVAYVCPHCEHLIGQKAEHRAKQWLACPSCKGKFQPSSPLVEADPNEPIGIAASERFDVGRNFCNKLWQASTGFVLPSMADYDPQPLDAGSLDLQDRWILSRLATCIETVNAQMDVYRYAESVMPIYRFFWNDFCDWYVEMAKPRIQSGGREKRVAQQVLAWVLDQAIRLLHPFIPFITEALWERLGQVAPKRGIAEPSDPGPVVISAEWPTSVSSHRDATIESAMDQLQGVIRAIRDIRANVNGIRSQEKKPSVRTLPQAVINTDRATADRIDAHVGFVKLLAGCDVLEVGVDQQRPPASAVQVVDATTEVYVSLEGLVDIATEIARLQGEIARASKQIGRSQERFRNTDFILRVPSHVLARERDQHREMLDRVNSFVQNLASTLPTGQMADLVREFAKLKEQIGPMRDRILEQLKPLQEEMEKLKPGEGDARQLELQVALISTLMVQMRESISLPQEVMKQLQVQLKDISASPEMMKNLQVQLKDISASPEVMKNLQAQLKHVTPPPSVMKKLQAQLKDITPPPSVMKKLQAQLKDITPPPSVMKKLQAQLKNITPPPEVVKKLQAQLKDITPPPSVMKKLQAQLKDITPPPSVMKKLQAQLKDISPSPEVMKKLQAQLKDISPPPEVMKQVQEQFRAFDPLPQQVIRVRKEIETAQNILKKALDGMRPAQERMSKDLQGMHPQLDELVELQTRLKEITDNLASLG